jgi:hypothetical protein
MLLCGEAVFCVKLSKGRLKGSDSSYCGCSSGSRCTEPCGVWWYRVQLSMRLFAVVAWDAPMWPTFYCCACCLRFRSSVCQQA